MRKNKICRTRCRWEGPGPLPVDCEAVQAAVGEVSEVPAMVARRGRADRNRGHRREITESRRGNDVCRGQTDLQAAGVVVDRVDVGQFGKIAAPEAGRKNHIHQERPFAMLHQNVEPLYYTQFKEYVNTSTSAVIVLKNKAILA